ncbi:MAG: type VI secretion system tip protein VgrG [Acidobacteriia bacterium]|nr:type VI secretion system tip protein VgrG [Terriglobia bacterium]
MSSYTQEDRLFKIDTPLGKDALLLQGFRGTEGISRLFHFELDLLSENSAISFSDIIGKNVTVSLKRADGSYRYINGFISRFAQTAMEETLTAYEAEMVPWLWFLTRNANCRIFQNKTVPDIITQVFDDLGFNSYSNSLQGTYHPRVYCVQYRESDFNFVSRLMEEYGIFYFFKHEQGNHTLVLADAPSAHATCPGQSSLRYVSVAGTRYEEDVVTSWRTEQELRTGKYSHTDYNFTTPSTSLQVSEPTVYTAGGNDKYETYDYPGRYLAKDRGENLAKVRMQEEEAGHYIANGTSDARALISGYKFTLKEHYRSDENADYVLTEIHHAGRSEAYGTSKGLSTDSYSNNFACIPLSVPFRPVRKTPRPVVEGVQPAIVVGPKGEEIYTDQYGRVKVQFYWDRVGKKDENSSCWVRVSQVWAGKNWGTMFIPRIGQEVIVDFVEGDPDRPMITGRVYNAEQMPPGTLPDRQNVSGLRTRSTKNGGEHDANVLAFDDTKGEEVFYMHAQKDRGARVENDDKLIVGNNQSITIHNNRTEVVEEGDETVTIKKGNRLVSVDMGNDTHTIKQGNRSVEINMGNDSLRIKMGNQDVKLDLGQSTTEAMQSITLKVGQSSIVLDQMGVTIKGMMISIEGQIQTQVKAIMTQINGSAMLQMQGGITMIN